MCFLKSKRNLILLLLLGFTILILDGCAPEPRILPRGNLIDVDKLNLIQPGKTNREKVAQLIGSPSSIALFKSDSWYYISERHEVLAFFPPEIKKRNVIVVHFDDTGIVSAVDQFGMEHSKKIVPVSRTTPTVGKELTIIDQMVGNFNRFRKKNVDKKDKQ